MKENYLDQLNNIFKQFGKKKELKKGDYIYQKKDKNIYFLEKGEAEGIINNTPIFYIKAKEISGEKSFLENTEKPIELKVISEDAIIYQISPECFEKFETNVKINFLKLLTLYTSERVYKLNSILTNIKLITKNIINNNLNDPLEIFSIFGNIENWLLFQKEKSFQNEEIIYICGNMAINDNLLNFVEQNKGYTIKIGKNFILFNTNKYLYLILGEINNNWYIISNTILYSEGLFEYLGDLLQQKKTEKINNLIKY